MGEEKLGHWASQHNYCRDNKIRTVRWELITINNKMHLFWVGLAVKTGFLSGHRVRNGHFWLLPASSASFPFFGSRIWLSPVVSEQEHLMSALISVRWLLVIAVCTENDQEDSTWKLCLEMKLSSFPHHFFILLSQTSIMDIFLSLQKLSATEQVTQATEAAKELSGGWSWPD